MIKVFFSFDLKNETQKVGQYPSISKVFQYVGINTIVNSIFLKQTYPRTPVQQSGMSVDRKNDSLTWRKIMLIDHDLEQGEVGQTVSSPANLCFQWHKMLLLIFWSEETLVLKISVKPNNLSFVFFFQIILPVMVLRSQLLCEKPECFKAQYHCGAALCKMWEYMLHARREGGAGSQTLLTSSETCSFCLANSVSLQHCCRTVAVFSSHVQSLQCMSTYVSMGLDWPQHVCFSSSLNEKW